MLRADLGQHTLSCGACGAPLRNLKMFSVAAKAPKPAISHQPRAAKPVYAKPKKPVKKRKKRKGFFRKFKDEAFDLVEDAFELVEDIFD
jgi:hypothetical protein|tara:strand:+ start:463 stop:729 length:267 start_codon:yes stop_codon:yes gene_type:complete